MQRARQAVEKKDEQLDASRRILEAQEDELFVSLIKFSLHNKQLYKYISTHHFPVLLILKLNAPCFFFQGYKQELKATVKENEALRHSIEKWKEDANVTR